MKNLKIFIFWFFDLFERFYINTNDPDLCIARRSGHRSRSTHFILPLKVGLVLSDFPLARFRMKILCGSEKHRKFSVRNAMKNATKPAGRVMPVLRRPCEDLLECCGGRASSGRADFCAISLTVYRMKPVPESSLSQNQK